MSTTLKRLALLLIFAVLFGGLASLSRKQPRQLIHPDTTPRIDRSTTPISITNVPWEYQVEYFGEIDDKTCFVIYSPTDPPDGEGYDHWLAWVGPADKLTELKVTQKSERQRDGGTTRVYTEKGMFYFPSPFGNDQPFASDEDNKKARQPTFEGKPIKRLPFRVSRNT